MPANPQNGGDACKEKPPIEAVTDNALRGIEALEGQVHELVDRLEPVTNQIPDVDGPGQPNEAAGSSKVYNAIDQLDTRIRNLTFRLQYLIQSLEV
jgi:hypothetical protein